MTKEKTKTQKYVYSTLSSDQAFDLYEIGGEKLPMPLSRVVIYGQANVAHAGQVNLWTPLGTQTIVSLEDFEKLKQNYIFNIFVQRGFITCSDVDEKPDIVAADMVAKDESAPVVPGDISVPDEYVAK